MVTRELGKARLADRLFETGDRSRLSLPQQRFGDTAGLQVAECSIEVVPLTGAAPLDSLKAGDLSAIETGLQRVVLEAAIPGEKVSAAAEDIADLCVRQKAGVAGNDLFPIRRLRKAESFQREVFLSRWCCAGKSPIRYGLTSVS